MVSATLLALTVRLYAPASIDADALLLAERQTAEILAHAGIALEWIDCRGARPLPERCAEPLRDDEVAVRYINADVAAYADRPLGEALVDKGAGRGALASIFLNRIAALAEASGVPFRVLCGRALAHELGHLLLGSNEHRPRGLMSAAWTRQTVKRGLATEWRFTPDDELRLRQQLASRSSVASARLSSN